MVGYLAYLGLLILLSWAAPHLVCDQFLTLCPAPGPAVVCWREGRKLTWGDFQAKQLPNVSAVDTSLGCAILANTATEAVVYDRTINGAYIKTVVRVEFYPDSSWVSPAKNYDRAAALAHEQLHFDITELTGRKIRRVLARCAAQHVNARVPAVTQKIASLYAEEARVQARYDREAGLIQAQAQAYWKALIRKELDALRAYKSTPADCTMPD